MKELLNVWILPVLWAALGSLGFGLLFGMRSKKLFYTALGGAITWLAYLLAVQLGLREDLSYAVSACIGTLYSEIMARVHKAPVTAFIIPVNIPLIPGGYLFYSFLGLLERNTRQFVDKGKYALGVAGTIALGIFVGTMLFRFIKEAFDLFAKRRINH